MISAENENKEMPLAGRIEKLIVDGQKEVVGRLDKLEAGQKQLEAGQKEIITRLGKLESEMKEIKFTVNAIDTALKLLQSDITELDKKLDVYMKQPA